MPEAFRVDKDKWKAVSFDGAGAAMEGGRWNSAGVRVVYTSEHMAMAALEKFIHLPKPVPAATLFVSFHMEFDEELVWRPAKHELPPDWSVSPVTDAPQKFGDAWVKAAVSAVLAIPSAMLPGETNFVLNPVHPDFAKIKISPHEAFTFDPRLAKLVNPAR